MPTYEYRCRECRYTFTKMQGINDEKKKRCPHCGGTLERLISGGTGFILKGHGFYKTDYKKSK